MFSASSTSFTLLKVVFVILAIALPRTARAQAVEVFDIGHLGGGSSSLTGISPSGEWACGWSTTAAGRTHAVLFRVPTRQLIDLGSYNNANTSAVAVNDSGVVVAHVTDSQNRGRAARISSPGAYQLLSLPDTGSPFPPSSEATAINREGDIIGRWTNWRNVWGTWAYAWDACVWMNDNQIQLSWGWPGDSFGTAISNRVPAGDVNARPWVVYERDYAGIWTTLAVLNGPYPAGSTFRFPGNEYARITDVNEAGDCIGSGGGSIYRYQNGTTVNLGSGGIRRMSESGHILLGGKIVRATDTQGVNILTQTITYANVTSGMLGGYYVFDILDISENKLLAGQARKMVPGTPTLGVIARFEICGEDGVSGPPVITQQPQVSGTPLCANGTLSLSVSATASGTPYGYQWRRNGVAINTSTNPTAATPNLVINGAVTPLVNGSQYDFTVTNVCGTTVSQPVTIQVGVQVTSQPPTTLYLCNTANIAANAVGAGPLTYQWRKNGTPIPPSTNPSATTATLSLVSAPGVNAQYDCVISDGCSSATTSATQVIDGFRIMAQPAVQVNLATTSQSTLSVSVEGVAPISYQWQRNGVPIDVQANPSAATPTLQLAAGGVCGSDRGGMYQCVVSNPCRTEISTSTFAFVDDPKVDRSFFVDPRQQYFSPFGIASDLGSRVARPIALSALGLQPGQTIRLVREGRILLNGIPASASTAMIGVFGSSITTSTTAITGLIAAGTPVVTAYSASNLDIPQDFAITDTLVTIPPGARYLAVMANAQYVGAATSDTGFNVRIEVPGATGVSPFAPAGKLPRLSCSTDSPGAIISMALRGDGKVLVSSLPEQRQTDDFETTYYVGPILSVYDPETMSFTTVLDGSGVSSPFGGLSIGRVLVLSDGDYLLSISSYDLAIGSTPVSGLARFDVATQSWSSVPVVTFADSYLIAQAGNGEIYFQGRLNPDDESWGLIRYNPATGLVGRIGESVGLHNFPQIDGITPLRNGDMLVLARTWIGGVYRDRVYRYTPATDQWTDLVASVAIREGGGFNTAIELAGGDLLVGGVAFATDPWWGFARYRSNTGVWDALSPGGVQLSSGSYGFLSSLSNGEVIGTLDGVSRPDNTYGLMNVRFDLSNNRFDPIGPLISGQILNALSLPDGSHLLSGNMWTTSEEYSTRCESLMRWSATGEASLRIARQPSDQSLCEPGPKTFSVVVQGSGTIRYQWQWKPAGSAMWFDVVDGPNADPTGGPDGFSAVGAVTNSVAVTITSGGQGAGGSQLSLRCVITGSCDVVTSDPAAVTTSSCRGCSLADIAGGGPDGLSYDGTVDGSDFIAFINSFGIGDASVDAAADVAGGGDSGEEPDGTIDGSDFIAFINAFAIGC